MKISAIRINALQTEILTWYGQNHRHLPWREIPLDQTLHKRDPYKILVSEIMLQQTQVARVIPKYEAWLTKFPTVHALAAATTADVLSFWSGLGYNRRALNLKKTAEVVASKYNGLFPVTEKELLMLPGIGLYTARALLCFAFNQQVAVVDTNVRKVILTKLITSDKDKQLKLGDRSLVSEKKVSEKEIQEIADAILPAGKAYEWNQALMDYSREVLKDYKIAIPKQSKFKGSRRYYRGQIIQILIPRKSVTIAELENILFPLANSAHKELLQEIIGELAREKFIEVAKSKIRLAA